MKSVIFFLSFMFCCASVDATIQISPSIPIILVNPITTNMKTLDNKSLKDFLSFPVKIIIKFYRSVLGKGIRSVCPMYPSCSTYGKEALQSFGPIIGSLKIVDRLNRCGHDTYIYPVIRIGDKLKYLDPVVWELP